MLDPADNTEGIPAFPGLDGMALPMVGADMKRVESLRPIAQAMVAAHPGAKITLCRFEIRTELEVIE